MVLYIKYTVVHTVVFFSNTGRVCIVSSRVRYLKKESGALISPSALIYLRMKEEERTHGHGIVVGNINIDPPHPHDCHARVRPAASQRQGRRRWPLSCFFPLPNHHRDGSPMMTNTMPLPHPTSAPPLALALAIAAKTGNSSGLFWPEQLQVTSRRTVTRETWINSHCMVRSCATQARTTSSSSGMSTMHQSYRRYGS